ncbi:MAG TPA: glycoside hydrolase family 15 protein [Azospirillaceae bacterium]|nr:glycoside hydrolase family 15 protein [Azospirillaceae bacterium]
MRALAAGALSLGMVALGTGIALAEPPGAPGAAPFWTTGAKEGIGTAIGAESPVWYALGQGVLQEVYYPALDVANVRELRFLVLDGQGKVTTEGEGMRLSVELADPRALTYRQVATDAQGRFRLTKTWITDPARPALLAEVRFEALDGGAYRLFAHYDPSLAGSGLCDAGSVMRGALVATDDGACDPEKVLEGATVATALMASTPFKAVSNGYAGSESDGAALLAKAGGLTPAHAAAKGGNLVQTAEISIDKDTRFTLALGFGPDAAAAVATAETALKRGWDKASKAYAEGWHDYLDGLAPAPKSVASDPALKTLYTVSVMGLKAHEDKKYPGAGVASLSHPWGEAQEADRCCRHGYHAVWARDLYHVATAMVAAGDKAYAERALDYLLNVQQKPDGLIPQNTRLNGKPIWPGQQMDQVAYPALMAWQLGRTDAKTWEKLKLSADYVADFGPDTQQERWEENSGASPATVAAEIAGLVAAADIAGKNGDKERQQRYLEMADLWQSKVKEWTVTSKGELPGAEGGRYFIRIAPKGQPDAADRITITNGGGNHDQRRIVDPSFLELVRLGVLPASDPDVVASLKVVDQVIGKPAPGGAMLYYRYNNDGYGETTNGQPYTGEGKGRLWPLLTGERGEYELAAGRDAMAHLRTMAATANQGHMIAEQVWDEGPDFGKGTGSATPLAWSMAQFVRLAHSIDAGRPAATPSIVAERYLKPKP